MDLNPKHSDHSNDEIQDFLQGVKRFWSAYGANLLLAVLIVVTVYLFVGYLKERPLRAKDDAYSDLAGSNSPEALIQVARTHESVPNFKAQALNRAAELYHALGTLGPADTAKELTKKPEEIEGDKKKALDQAQKVWEEVLTLSGPPIELVHAHFGLSSVAASKGDFKAARTHLEEARKLAANYTVIVEDADRQIAELDRLSKPVTFIAPPVKKPEEIKIPGVPPGGIPGVPSINDPLGGKPLGGDLPAPAIPAPNTPAPAVPAPVPAPNTPAPAVPAPPTSPPAVPAPPTPPPAVPAPK